MIEQMSEIENPAVEAHTATRRQVVTRAAIVFAGLAAGSRVWGKMRQSMPETESTGPDWARTHLHQEVDFKATPQRIYAILLDAKQFAAVTGMPAEIDPKVGGAFSTFGGLIVGQNVELVLNQRIVQAWRPSNWDPGIYTLVKFELKEQGSQTRIVLDHTGFPEGNFGHLDSGWHQRYWEPLKKYLA